MCQPVRAFRVVGSRRTIFPSQINALAAMAMIAVFLLPFSFPAEAQHIICCNSLIDVNGKWVGVLRNCPGELAKLNEPERKQAKAAYAALDALKKARAAKEEVDELEAKCRDSESSTSPPREGESEDDEYKPTGQREYEAALKLRQSWKRVGEGNVDAQGSWHDADLALQRALEIIQSGQTGAAEQLFRKVGLASDYTEAGVLAQNSITDNKAIEAGNFMSVGFNKEARALAAFQLVLAELARTTEIGGSPKVGTKPSPH